MHHDANQQMKLWQPCFHCVIYLRMLCCRLFDCTCGLALLMWYGVVGGMLYCGYQQQQGNPQLQLWGMLLISPHLIGFFLIAATCMLFRPSAAFSDKGVPGDMTVSFCFLPFLSMRAGMRAYAHTPMHVPAHGHARMNICLPTIMQRALILTLRRASGWTGGIS